MGVRQIVHGVSKRGVSPSFLSSPSPSKERGIKGVRLIANKQYTPIIDGS